ncbi:MAG: hypothetical protein AAFZ02_10315 [Pseudomonadota bacterium]
MGSGLGRVLSRALGAGGLAFIGCLAALPATGQSTDEARTAILATKIYLNQLVRDPGAAEELRSPGFRDVEPRATYLARWRKMVGDAGDMKRLAVSGVSFYGPEHSGREDMVAAVDFVSLTEEPRLICGSFIWGLGDEMPELIREEVGMAEPYAVRGADRAQMEALVASLSCKMPPG